MTKLKRKNKKKVTRRKKYNTAGMYQDNQIPAGIGSTTMTVYQESNPQIQAQREAELAAQKDKAIADSEEMSKTIEDEKALDKDKIAAAKAEGEGTADAIAGYGSQGLQLADQAGLFGDAPTDAATQAKQDKQSTLGALKSARNVYRAARGAKKTMKMVKGYNQAKTAFDVSQRLNMGEQAWKMKKSLDSAKTFKEGLDTTKTMFKTADQIKAGASGLQNASLGVDMATTMDKTTGLIQATDKTKQLAQGSAIGKGLKDFATSGAGIGLIATGLGAGAKKIWGDDDDTKYNAGEVTGDILSGVGTGMSTAAMLGSVVPGVGNVAGAVVGGLYGLGKGLVGQAKAKKEQRKIEQERSEKIKKFNTEVSEDLGAQMARARAGELKQKRYSGYDLGRNVTARRGGYRGMPRYAY